MKTRTKIPAPALLIIILIINHVPVCKLGIWIINSGANYFFVENHVYANYNRFQIQNNCPKQFVILRTFFTFGFQNYKFK